MELTSKGDRDSGVGTVLDGKRRLERRIGKGGMGTVYEATHLLMERQVVVKVLNEAIADDSMVLRRFRREAVAASRLSHPNLVQVLDMAQTDDGLAYMVPTMLENDGLPSHQR